jgi:antitoxin component of MazEF toxin-antitoxin module
MVFEVKVIQIGESLGIELPEALVKSQNLRVGDTLTIHET